jgi:hypothetical protein
MPVRGVAGRFAPPRMKPLGAGKNGAGWLFECGCVDGEVAMARAKPTEEAIKNMMAVVLKEAKANRNCQAAGGDFPTDA